MIKKPNSLRLATKATLIAALMAVTWIGQVEAEEKPFKFEILPSEKCKLEKVPEVDTQLKCINLIGAPKPSPTNPGDPRPDKQQSKSMSTSPSEMQTVLDWCKKNSGTWTSDGKNGGSCRSIGSLTKYKADCKAMGKVWDGGKGEGGCTGTPK